MKDPSPDTLKRFLGNPVRIILNRGRRVCGTLKGFDQQLNVNLFDTVEERKENGQVTTEEVGMAIIRGSSIIHVEVLTKVDPVSDIVVVLDNSASLPLKEGPVLDENLKTSSSEDNPAIEKDVSAMETAEAEPE